MPSTGHNINRRSNSLVRYLFSAADWLEAHLKLISIHFKICGKAFVFKSKYTRHYRTVHIELKESNDNIGCHYCMKLFDQRTALKDHIRYKHEVYDFKCDVSCSSALCLLEHPGRGVFKGGFGVNPFFWEFFFNLLGFLRKKSHNPRSNK